MHFRLGELANPSNTSLYPNINIDNDVTTSVVCDLLNWYHPNRHLRSANTTSLVPNRNETITFGKRLMDTASASL